MSRRVTGVEVGENEKKIHKRTTRLEDRYNNCSPASTPEILVGIS
jgi:hypothetical protein